MKPQLVSLNNLLLYHWTVQYSAVQCSSTAVCVHAYRRSLLGICDSTLPMSMFPVYSDIALSRTNAFR